MTDHDALDVARDLFDALGRGDLETYRRLMDPTAVVWTNFDDRRHDAAGAERLVAFLVDTVEGLHYEIVRREPIPDGFVQQHVLRGRAPDGTELAMPACLWATVRDGRVVAMEEYLDPAALAALATR